MNSCAVTNAKSVMLLTYHRMLTMSTVFPTQCSIVHT